MAISIWVLSYLVLDKAEDLSSIVLDPEDRQRGFKIIQFLNISVSE